MTASYHYATAGGNVDLGSRVRGITASRVASYPQDYTKTVVVPPPAHFILPRVTLRSGDFFQQRSRMWRKPPTTCEAEASPPAANTKSEEAQVIPPPPWRRPGSQVALPGSPRSGRKSQYNSRQDGKNRAYDGGRNRVFTEAVQRLRDAHVAEDVDEIVKDFSLRLRDPLRNWQQILSSLLFDDETKNLAKAQEDKQEERVAEGVEGEDGDGGLVDLAKANAAGRGWPLISLVFKSIQSQPFYQPNPLWYSKLISLAGRCNQPEASWQLLLQYQSLGLPPDSVVLNSVMKVLARGGMEDKALEVLEGMKGEGGCGVTLVSYNIMVAAFCRGAREAEAEEIVKEIRGGGWVPDSYTYTPLIHAYTKTYQWEPAQVVLERVIEEKVKLSSSLPYGHLIRCFRVTKKFDAMERAYTAMVAEGYEVPEISWEIALEGFALGGKMKFVQYLLNQSGVEHTPDVYATIFKFAGKSCAEHAPLAEQLYPFFERFHANPDHTKPDYDRSQLVPVYVTAIEAFGALGSCDRMAQILQCMVEGGVEIEAPTFIAMVHGFGRSDMREEMENIFGVLKEVVPPTPDVFRSMLSVYERMEDVEKVEEMKASIAHLKAEAKKKNAKPTTNKVKTKKKSGDSVAITEVGVASVY